MFDSRNPWSIFDELESLQAGMNRVLSGQPSGRGGRRGGTWRHSPAYPLMNVWASEDGLVIEAEMPGVDPKDVDISVMDDELTLRGKVNAVAGAENETYHRRERPEGEFARTLQLSFRADTAAIKANYKNGVLRLTVPRSEDEKPRKIKIEA